jgi:hypothetical protein
MGNVPGAVLAGLGALIGLAIVAVIVSQKAQTSSVIQSAGSALASVIGAAVSPVSGASGNSFGGVGQTVQGVNL